MNSWKQLQHLPTLKKVDKIVWCVLCDDFVSGKQALLIFSAFSGIYKSSYSSNGTSCTVNIAQRPVHLPTGDDGFVAAEVDDYAEEEVMREGPAGHAEETVRTTLHTMMATYAEYENRDAKWAIRPRWPIKTRMRVQITV